MSKRDYGFTIVELLIVIVVIGILAALVISTFSNVRREAQATAIADGLSKTSKSMKAWAIGEGFSEWTLDGIYKVGGNPTLTELQEKDNFKSYLQEVPDVEGVGTEQWFYDSDLEAPKTDCTRAYAGTNIVVRYIDDTAMVQRVDEILDDGNFSCGNVRYTGNTIFYNLSYDQSIDY